MTLKLQKKRALELVAKGLKLDDVAEILGVSSRSVQRWVSKDRGRSDLTDIADDPVTTASIATVVESPKEQSKSVQLKAIEMFQGGFEFDAIAKELGVSSRTLERWISSNSPEQTQKLISSYPPELQSAIVSKIPNTPCWVDDVEKTLDEHQKCHEGIRRKLAVILHNQLDNPEINYRAVHIVSQALIRHGAAERESLTLQWLDANRALALLQAHGLSVVDISQLEALKLQRKN